MDARGRRRRFWSCVVSHLRLAQPGEPVASRRSRRAPQEVRVHYVDGERLRRVRNLHAETIVAIGELLTSFGGALGSKPLERLATALEKIAAADVELEEAARERREACDIGQMEGGAP